MNKLKLLKDSILSTALLSFVIWFCIASTLIVFPIFYSLSIDLEEDVDIDIYSEDIADYCVVNFENVNQYYVELCKTFDMENYAGLAYVGSIEVKEEDNYMNTFNYSVNIVSQKMIEELPSLGYDFSKAVPAGCTKAYAPFNFKNEYEIGQDYDICVNKGDYEYKRKLNIIGFVENDYYEFRVGTTQRMLSSFGNSFLICDDIPDYAKIESGLMMSDKSAEDYRKLGVSAETLRELNERQKSMKPDNFSLYWIVCIIFLIAVSITANYYFSADKMMKRSGVMFIYGGARKDIILIEFIKLMLIFLAAFVLTLSIIAITISYMSGIFYWGPYFLCAGITFVIYCISISFGFVKFAMFKPLSALSNNNIE